MLRLATLAAGLWASSAYAITTGCPLIRPAGLTDAQVDALVMARVAQALQQAPAQLDAERSLAQMSSATDVPALYGFAALAIGEALGFDAVERFRHAAASLGSDAPHAALSVMALQAVARQAYQAGEDAAPPAAQPGASYRIGPVQVSPPTVSAGWRVLRCGHDQVAFGRRGAADDESVTAVVRIIGLPIHERSEDFVAYLRTVLLASLPPGHLLRSLDVRPEPEARVPCVFANLVARAEYTPFRMRARFCRPDRSAAYGSAVLFSHAGSDDVLQFEREAQDFLAQVRLQ